MHQRSVLRQSSQIRIGANVRFPPVAGVSGVSAFRPLRPNAVFRQLPFGLGYRCITTS